MTASTATTETFAQALSDAWAAIRRTIPRLGTERPRIGNPDLTYERCGDSDWVDSFWNGQLWLAYAETGDQAFFAAARAQRPYFVDRLARPASHNHDLGFLYSLSTVADYNPVTYLLGGMRALLLEGWETEPIFEALAAIIGIGLVSMTLALLALRGRLRRGA